ncbi:helix-turn-helix transcriptional regulator [Staphylococcus chromogenes]|uniref:helix-turn-helix domain-containing protein n=1 Tax=Staphylococcus chromogenes TaxID=46126 RepID=UPI003B008F88
MNIGDNIKKIRKEKGMKQTDFAKLLNISQSYLSDLENGRKNISIDTANQIAKKLNVTMGYLTSGNKMYSDLSDKEKREQFIKINKDIAKKNTIREQTLKNNLLELIKRDLQYIDVHFLNNSYNFFELEKDNTNNLIFISVLLQQLYNYKGSGKKEHYDELMNDFSNFLKDYLNIK